MGQYKVTSKNVLLRRKPDSKSGAVKKLMRGQTVVSSEEETGEWICVEADGVSGYCRTEELERMYANEYDDDSIGAALDDAIARVEEAFSDLKSLIARL